MLVADGKFAPPQPFSGVFDCAHRQSAIRRARSYVSAGCS
jgi:hypothetical protein